MRELLRVLAALWFLTVVMCSVLMVVAGVMAIMEEGREESVMTVGYGLLMWGAGLLVYALILKLEK